MFEHSLIDLETKQHPRSRRWISLPMAIGLHLVGLTAFAFASYWSVGKSKVSARGSLLVRMSPQFINRRTLRSRRDRGRSQLCLDASGFHTPRTFPSGSAIHAKLPWPGMVTGGTRVLPPREPALSR